MRPLSLLVLLSLLCAGAVGAADPDALNGRVREVQNTYEQIVSQGYVDKHYALKLGFYDAAVAMYPDAMRWLEGGCGGCGLMWRTLADGIDSYGVEISTHLVTTKCGELARLGRVRQASLASIPHADSSFDLVFSSEVFEHIPNEEVQEAMDEVVRVTRGDLFLTISSTLSAHDPRPPAEPTVHVQVHKREWWVREFAKRGCREVEGAEEAVFDGPYIRKEMVDKRKVTESRNAVTFVLFCDKGLGRSSLAEPAGLLSGRPRRHKSGARAIPVASSPWGSRKATLQEVRAVLYGLASRELAAADSLAPIDTSIRAAFVVLCVAALAARHLATRGGGGGGGGGGGAKQPSSSASGSAVAPSAEGFAKFRSLYLVGFLLMAGADWLQGPYVYALYQFYGFSEEEIAQLFVAGFAASMVFGLVAGPAADRYGRRLSCLTYGVLYAASCVLKHSSDYGVLMAGRLLGGACTSILFSSFEAWAVHEHKARGFSDSQLGDLFAAATGANGLVAIGAGVAASAARDSLGPVGPFDLSFALLVAGSAVVATTWSENHGDRGADMRSALSGALAEIRGSRAVSLVGAAQAAFEGAMYVFVFMWTPALGAASGAPDRLEHGWLFACFMCCVMLGSSAFAASQRAGVAVERVLVAALAVAAASLFVPVLSNDYETRVAAFFVFEGCVGVYWPCAGCLRGRHVPDAVRATVGNLFRVPLNMIVVAGLLNIGSLSQAGVFSSASACLVVSLCAAAALPAPASA